MCTTGRLMHDSLIIAFHVKWPSIMQCPSTLRGCCSHLVAKHGALWQQQVEVVSLASHIPCTCTSDRTLLCLQDASLASCGVAHGEMIFLLYSGSREVRPLVKRNNLEGKYMMHWSRFDDLSRLVHCIAPAFLFRIKASGLHACITWHPAINIQRQ